jgi:hypothetical protein
MYGFAGPKVAFGAETDEMGIPYVPVWQLNLHTTNQPQGDGGSDGG